MWSLTPIVFAFAALMVPLADGRIGSSPDVCRIEGPPVELAEVPEASGVAVSRRTPGRLWVHNDSGKSVLFGIDSAGRVVQRVRILGATLRDWEDIAAGRCQNDACLYLADIGDNGAKRQTVTIYQVKEPGGDDTEVAPARAFEAQYPDGAHDAEAFFVMPGGDMFIVTKEVPASVYRFPRPGGDTASTVTLEKVKTLGGLKGRVTGGAATEDGRWIALRTHKTVAIFRGDQFVSALPADPILIDVTALREAQGEGVAFGGGGLFLVGEGGGGHRPGTFARLRCTLPVIGG